MVHDHNQQQHHPDHVMIITIIDNYNYLSSLSLLSWLWSILSSKGCLSDSYSTLSLVTMGTQLILNGTYLIGGLEHEFYFSIYWECHHPNWRTHFFQRGGLTTNQLFMSRCGVKHQITDRWIRLLIGPQWASDWGVTKDASKIHQNNHSFCLGIPWCMVAFHCCIDFLWMFFSDAVSSCFFRWAIWD
jgi:hypothetical protein